MTQSTLYNLASYSTKQNTKCLSCTIIPYFFLRLPWLVCLLAPCLYCSKFELLDYLVWRTGPAKTNKQTNKQTQNQTNEEISQLLHPARSSRPWLIQPDCSLFMAVIVMATLEHFMQCNMTEKTKKKTWVWSLKENKLQTPYNYCPRFSRSHSWTNRKSKKVLGYLFFQSSIVSEVSLKNHTLGVEILNLNNCPY